MTPDGPALDARLTLAPPLTFGVVLALAPACGGAEAETLPVLEFDTRPTCAAADATCLNAGTSTLDVEGVHVIHKPLEGHPLVSFRISFDAPVGSSRQRWAETLAFNVYELGGPRRLDTAAWDAELLRLGGAVSSSNGFDYGTISASVPSANWRELWDLVIDGIAEYRNNTWELANRLGIYQRAFQVERDDPGSASSLDAWSRLFQGHAYNYQREHADLLATVTTRDIDAAWAALAQRDRWVVTIAGDVSVDAIRAALSDAIDRLGPSGTNASASFAPDPARTLEPAPAVRVMSYPEAPTWYIIGSFKGPSGSSLDFAPLELGLAVLDRRLFEEVRDVRGLAYSTGADLSFYRESFGSVWITSESPLEALAVSRQVLAELKAAGPTEAELAAARSSLSTRLLTRSDTPSNVAATLADWELTAGAREALDDYVAALAQATPAAVASVLDAYLRDVKIAAAGAGSPLAAVDLENWFVSP